MAVALLANSLKPVLEKLCEPFGGIDQVSLTQTHLEYISLFPGFSVIAKPWAREVNLLARGFRPGTSYRVFDRDIRFLYEVCPPEDSPLFGLDDRDLEELTFRKNGDYLHIQFVGDKGPTCGLIWIQNQIPPQLAKKQIEKWLVGIEVSTPRQSDHELFADTSNLEASMGQVVIYFVPGTWEQQLSVEDILLSGREDVIISRREHNESLLLYPNVSGWYVFVQEKPVTGERTFLALSERYGIGVRRIRQVGNAFFFQSQNTDLGPSVPDPYESISNTSPLNWASSNHRMRVEARLDYSLLINIIGRTIVTVEADPMIRVPCEDILASGSFGGSEFLEVNELDAAGFMGNSLSANDCYVFASVGTGNNPASSAGHTQVMVYNSGSANVISGGGGSIISLESDIYTTTHVIVNGGLIINGVTSISNVTGSSTIHVVGGTNQYTSPASDANPDDTNVLASGSILYTGEANIILGSTARVFALPGEEKNSRLIGNTALSAIAHKFRNGEANLTQSTTVTASASMVVESSPVTITGLTTCVSGSTVIMTCISPVDVIIEGTTTLEANGELANPSSDVLIEVSTVVLVASEVTFVDKSKITGTTTLIVVEEDEEISSPNGTLNLIMSGTFVKVDEDDPLIHLL